MAADFRTGCGPAFEVFALGTVTVVVGLDAVVVVAGVVVVEVELLDVVLDELDDAVVDDELALGVVTFDAFPCGIGSAADARRAAKAGTLFISTGSARIGATARTVAMRRLIETSIRSRPAH